MGPWGTCRGEQRGIQIRQNTVHLFGRMRFYIWGLCWLMGLLLPRLMSGSGKCLCARRVLLLLDTREVGHQFGDVPS